MNAGLRSRLTHPTSGLRRSRHAAGRVVASITFASLIADPPTYRLTRASYKAKLCVQAALTLEHLHSSRSGLGSGARNPPVRMPSTTHLLKCVPIPCVTCLSRLSERGSPDLVRRRLFRTLDQRTAYPHWWELRSSSQALSLLSLNLEVLDYLTVAFFPKDIPVRSLILRVGMVSNIS